MAGVLYSTNPFLKLFIQQKYRKDNHYVWCSEHFDGKAAPRYSAPSLIAPSSNPVDIYKALKSDVERSDRHSVKINEQIMGMTGRANQWHEAGEITQDEMEEIIYLVNQQDFSQWRPLLYVIPITPSILERRTLVNIKNRASSADEFIISDLHISEFDIIEF